jgi:anti-sigma B factor antagonist
MNTTVHNEAMDEIPEHLTAEFEVTDGRAAMLLRGDFDLVGKEAFVAAIGSILASGANEVAIDMSGVSFIDSSGVGALLEAHHLGLSVVIHRPSERVRKLLDLVLIGNIIPISEV